MPSSLRVSSTPSRRLLSRSRCARSSSCASVFQGPITCASSARFGVMTRRARIAAVVVTLRVHQHRLSRRPRQLDHPRDVRQPALAVVGKQHRVMLGQHPREVASACPPAPRGPAGSRNPRRTSCCARPMTRSFTQVKSCGSLPSITSHRLRLQQALEPARRLVLAHHGNQRNACGPSDLTFNATLAAPPSRCSSRVTRTTGTGASGEMRSTRRTGSGRAWHRRRPARARAAVLP